MSIDLNLPELPVLHPRITVVGVGGAGGNAVNNMIQSNLQGVNFVVANTDAQALEKSLCNKKIQLGINLTRGLGAGALPDVGKGAAEESIDEIMEHIKDSHMLFITAGMGGGTGTGAAPVIAKAAREAKAAVRDKVSREKKILTVGVVTKPFSFEGVRRMRIAELGLEELQKYVDTLIVIPNQNLFRIANEKTTFSDAFKLADNVLHIGIRGVTDLMVMPGLINLDFADIETVMSEMGKAMIGTGEAEGEDRAINAAEAAISNPLLDNVSMKGAQGILINITGGLDMTLFEVDSAANRVREEVDEDANIIFGATFDEAMEGRIRVSVLATGIDGCTDTGTERDHSERNDKETFKWSYSQSESHIAQKEKNDTDQKHRGESEEKIKWNGNIYDIPAYLRRKK
jgi:cell division protein FtsZ